MLKSFGRKFEEEKLTCAGKSLHCSQPRPPPSASCVKLGSALCSRSLYSTVSPETTLGWLSLAGEGTRCQGLQRKFPVVAAAFQFIFSDGFVSGSGKGSVGGHSWSCPNISCENSSLWTTQPGREVQTQGSKYVFLPLLALPGRVYIQLSFLYDWITEDFMGMYRCLGSWLGSVLEHQLGGGGSSLPHGPWPAGRGTWTASQTALSPLLLHATAPAVAKPSQQLCAAAVKRFRWGVRERSSSCLMPPHPTTPAGILGAAGLHPWCGGGGTPFSHALPEPLDSSSTAASLHLPAQLCCSWSWGWRGGVE